MRRLCSTLCLIVGVSLAPLAQADPPRSGAMQEMHGAMRSMHQQMHHAARTGDPDRDFVAMMIPHHQGAIDMAKAYLKEGKDPEIRRLAEKIEKDQAKEIAQMEAWQKRHPAAH